jgi:NitT/TauT family transport system substrate-binding protein
MREHGIVDSGDSLTLGIGAMTPERWQGFLDTMTVAGVYPKGVDASRAYTLQFVNRKVGMELKPAP